MTYKDLKEVARSLVIEKARNLMTQPNQSMGSSPEDLNIELARATSGRYPIQTKQGSNTNSLMQGLQLMGLAGTGSRNPAVTEAYNRIKSRQGDSQDRELLNKVAMDELIKSAQFTGGVRQVPNIGKALLMLKSGQAIYDSASKIVKTKDIAGNYINLGRLAKNIAETAFKYK